jgi:hypothetical protein
MPRILLHLGVHKTATTYIQKKLALNAGLLADRHIHYDPLDVFRKGFTSLLKEDTTRANDYVTHLMATAASMTLLVSEENILGVPGELVRDGRYYGRARRRLGRTAELLQTDNPEIYLGLRDYASFAVSMYCEYIRHQKFLTFADYWKIVVASGFSWMTVIEDIHAAVPGARIVLWDFADFRRIEEQIFAAMLDFDPGLLVNPERSARESFSATAIRSFEALSGALDHQDLKKIMGPVARNFPKGNLYPAFDPLDAAIKAELKTRFSADMEMIAERYPEITFLGQGKD